MKVIIAGCRYSDVENKIIFSDYQLLIETIKKSGLDITEVVCGMAIGTDRMGEQWALANNIAIKEMPADWHTHGKAAGPIRNRAMAEYADGAIILWDGKSEGTRNMINEMIKFKKPYHIGMTISNIDKFFN